MSPQKVREVTREVQGMHVSKALALLAYTPKKSAMLIGRVLQSAIANAVNNNGMDEESLYIKSCTATDGGTLKRIMPRARGSASPIIKRMSHITVIVAPTKEAAEAPMNTDKVVEVVSPEDVGEVAPKAKKASKKKTADASDTKPSKKAKAVK